MFSNIKGYMFNISLRLSKKRLLRGSEIPRNEAYIEVRRSDEG
jgi:hypothetical protein